MSDTRRGFLKSGTALAAGLMAGAPAPAAETQPVQVPKMKFGGVEISRLILGTNPFYGYSHHNGNFDFEMRSWYTPERIVEVMKHAQSFGINTFNYVNIGRTSQDLQKFYDAGGKMNLLCQIIGDPEPTYKQFKPFAMYNQGEQVDKAYNAGNMEPVKEWCKKARQLGVLVGVGTHRPDVITLVEDQGWDVDFYAGCVYNRNRTADEWKRLLNGEIGEVPTETYLAGDPERMYKVMRQTKKPCFAFKVLAAGRLGDKSIEPAFRTAFGSIKPTDGVFVGMFPHRKDEVKENAEIVARILGAKTT
jgi:hypothetical protein